MNQYVNFMDQKWVEIWEKSSNTTWQLLILVEAPPAILKWPLKCSDCVRPSWFQNWILRINFSPNPWNPKKKQVCRLHTKHDSQASLKCIIQTKLCCFMQIHQSCCQFAYISLIRAFLSSLSLDAAASAWWLWHWVIRLTHTHYCYCYQSSLTYTNISH